MHDTLTPPSWHAPVRTLDEGLAWARTMDLDGAWMEDENIFCDIMASVNSRELETQGGYAEDALIFNEMILEPKEPLSTFVYMRMGKQPVEFQMRMSEWIEHMDNLGTLTKAELMDIVREKGLTGVIKERMLKQDIISALAYLTH